MNLEQQKLIFTQQFTQCSLSRRLSEGFVNRHAMGKIAWRTRRKNVKWEIMWCVASLQFEQLVNISSTPLADKKIIKFVPGTL